jgi:transcriptional regulator with XRE-family HTH domain
MRNTDPPVRRTWATLVKQMREATGMSGAELGRRLKVDRATVWRWEAGRQRPENLDLVQAFAELFRVDLDEALVAAGMRPAEPAVRQELERDPDYQELGRLLDDPRTPEEIKERIRTVLRAVRELIDAQQPRPPHRKAG